MHKVYCPLKTRLPQATCPFTFGALLGTASRMLTAPNIFLIDSGYYCNISLLSRRSWLLESRDLKRLERETTHASDTAPLLDRHLDSWAWSSVPVAPLFITRHEGLIFDSSPVLDRARGPYIIMYLLCGLQNLSLK